MSKLLTLLLMLALAASGAVTGFAAAKGGDDDRLVDDREDGDEDDDEDDNGTDRGRRGPKIHVRHGNSTDDDNETEAHRTRGHAHAFGSLDNATKAEAKAEWKEAGKGKPSWFGSLLEKIRGHPGNASQADEKRHGGLAEASSHVPDKVAEKFAKILSGAWGRMKHAFD